MAFIVVADPTKESGKMIKPVSPEQGAHIWAVMRGETDAETPEQAAFMENVLDVYLNVATAPLSYVAARSHVHAAMQPQESLRLPDFGQRQAGEASEREL